MPEPLTAWAAVAPDGTIDHLTVRNSVRMVKYCVGRCFASDEDADAGWEEADRAGWRVVRVRIEVVEAAKKAAVDEIKASFDFCLTATPEGTARKAIDKAFGIIAADAERRVRDAVLEEAAAHFDALAADIGAFATDRVATIIRALKDPL